MKTYDNRTQRKARTVRLSWRNRFDLPSAPAAPYRGLLDTDLEHLKSTLLKELLTSASEPEFHAPLRRAVNDAAAIAWTTAYPLLVLPELVREKAENARSYVRRQAAFRQRHAVVGGVETV